MTTLVSAPSNETLPERHAGESPPPIEVRNISKRFGSLQALLDVSMKLAPGSFRALLGENGAGKSTLVKCIMGTYRADSGTVSVGTHAVELKNPRQAHALGIGMVYQHFTLVENMTVVENMLMAGQHVPAVVNWKAETEKLEAFMKTMPFRVEPRAMVRNLSAGEKQKVEILKQLYLRRKVLILDEPTSVLTPDEADEVLGMVRAMCDQRQLSVLMITHKFREVMAFCDEVSVLRQGRLMGEGLLRDLSPEVMARMMMGDATIPQQAARKDTNGLSVSEPRLVIRDLCADDETGVAALSKLSLHVCAHEIVGIAGVSGNGQRELVQVLAGQREATSGQVVVCGKKYRAVRDEMRRHRFHVLPEMPLQNACVGNMTVAENLAFRVFDRPPLTRLGKLVNPRAMRDRAVELIGRYHIRPTSPAAKIAHLSGGNIQRAVLARELGEGVEVLIAANPCFGLDFKAVAEIRSQLVEARNRGAAVLLVSEDLDEILELADRTLVISEGRIVYETAGASADRHVIGRHMAGHQESLARTIAAQPYEYLFDPAHTALVIIDMQRDFIEPGGFGAALGNDVSRLSPAVPAVAALLGAFRERGLTIVHTKECHRPDLADCPPSKRVRGRAALRIGDEGPMGRILIDGEPGNDFVTPLEPRPGEVIISKPGKGAFYDTSLQEQLQSRSITHLLLTGVTTEVCVQTTMREANDRGYECLLVEDATESYFPEFKQATLEMIRAQGGIVGWTASAAEVLKSLQD